MHHVYVLQSKKNQSLYIGMTTDLERRLNEHNSGKVYFTSRHYPYNLIYYESYQSIELAKERERQLKRFDSAYYSLLKRIKIIHRDVV
ncbi:MAG: GIY-YIG nuclease family protein [Patescibacteria group bacterium]